MGLHGSARRIAARFLRPLALRAAKSYIAGEKLEDALPVAARFAAEGVGVTLGYWDSSDEPARHVTDSYLDALRALAGSPHAYLSIKLPAIGFSPELMAELISEAHRHGVRVHLDAMGFESVDATRRVCEAFLNSGVTLSVTLPGRWRRSVDDAQWAIERGLAVRVVKGQWPDPDWPDCDLREGFMQVIEVLAGRATRVAVASHDVPLVADAVSRLQRAGTPCEIELLYGLPMQESLAQAAALGLDVNVYVPYGRAFLPYALSRLRHQPRVMWWLLRDLFTSKHPRPVSAPAIEEQLSPTP